MSQKLTHVGLGLNLDDAISLIHGIGKPGVTGGMPDEVGLGSLYSNDTDGGLWNHTDTSLLSQSLPTR